MTQTIVIPAKAHRAPLSSPSKMGRGTMARSGMVEGKCDTAPCTAAAKKTAPPKTAQPPFVSSRLRVNPIGLARSTKSKASREAAKTRRERRIEPGKSPEASAITVIASEARQSSAGRTRTVIPAQAGIHNHHRVRTTHEAPGSRLPARPKTTPDIPTHNMPKPAMGEVQ